MSYGDIYLENMEIPKEAFDKLKKDYEWQQEAAPGIYRMVWNVDANAKRPAFMHDMSGAGIMHGMALNYADKKMNKLNKALDKTGKNWHDYILSEIDKNPVLSASDDACIYDWSGISIYLWTSKEDEVPVLLSEVSKAIRKLMSGGEAALSPELQEALDKGDVEAYTEAFVELMGEGGKQEIELAFNGGLKLLDQDLDPLLLAAMAVSTMKIGTKQLKAFAKEADLADDIIDMGDGFADEFIMALQQFYQQVMYAGNDWIASKELVKRYYDNISEVMKIYGFKVKKMAIMTMIFLFYNDVIEGIGFDSYMDDEDYRDDEWPYTDTDLSFWKKFDPDSVTGLKTDKGGYNIEGDDDEDDDYDDEEDDDDGFTKYLEFEDDKSHKFWSIKLEGDSFTVNYGKVGSTGQTQTKEFESEEKAEQEAIKLYNSKIKKGYEEV